MKGDFSQSRFRPTDNFTGTLYQQGRVFSDQDGNSADAIGRHLRQLLGRDTIGPGIVAVPKEAQDSLRIVGASSDGVEVTVDINPGRAWLDGLHLYVPGTAPQTRVATYFGPSIDTPAPIVASIAAGVRDAVVLECWEEAVSAFQVPEDLIEPALGGVDTTERVVVRHRLRLLRLQPGEDCANLSRMDDDLDAQGHLTVTPAPTAVIAGDCPVQMGGGFTGFEHSFYRIEIATPDAGGNARFKWSRFNGGLVGRGSFDSVLNEIILRANAQMIALSQLSDFHVEVLAPGPANDPGQWIVAMTADATLVGSDRLSLANIEGAWPGLPTTEAYFRLWDGRRPIQDFPTGLASPNELELGIRLEFDPPAADNGNYRLGDYWTFPARAAGVDFDPASWPANAPPQGVDYHRAPLGILNWNAGPVVTLGGPPEIHDCRGVFKPLTRIRSCCSYSVGDGMTSTGDFETIQAAVDALPPEGGEICVLPGTYDETVVIDKDDVHIHGCGMRSRVIADSAAPVFHAAGRSGIHIEQLFIRAAPDGIGILVETDVQGVEPSGILLADLGIEAVTDSAIKILGAREVTILRNVVTMADVASPWHAVYLRASEALVEHNVISVAPRAANVASVAFIPGGVHAGRGGLHLAGTCTEVKVLDNRIRGGIGQGITLGSLIMTIDGAEDGDPGWVVDRDDPCDPCHPGSTTVPPGTGRPGEPNFRSAGALYDIRIAENRIAQMGLAGIGVIGFFDLSREDEFISVVGLHILDNRITGCLARELAEIPEELRPYAGYGAVALADVEDLRFYDNVLEDNGPSERFPVCGLYVLHGAALDIARNQVLNTGAKSPSGAGDAAPGARGGIVIRYAVPGLVPLELNRELYPRQDGRPAARIHDNVVSQPLGQALSLQALGPVSVEGNALTTRGLIVSVLDPSFWASAVWILNLGWSTEFYLQFALFSGATADPIDPGQLPRGGDDFVPRPREGLDDFGAGRYLASGNVLFHDNQVVTDLTETAASFAISSVLIVSLDDVSVQDNQLDCDFLVDLLFTNLLAVGMTLRINNNRMKETLFITLYSSVGLGLIFNNTSDNQATHCILSLESPLGLLIPFINPHIVEQANQELFHAFTFLEGWCERLDALGDILIPDRQPPPDVGPTNDFNANFGMVPRGG